MASIHESEIQVLLVEDNELDARLIRLHLEESWHGRISCHLAGTLAEAIHFLQDQQDVVVLLDLSLPDSTGLQGFTRLHEKFPEVPVVVLTGLDDDQTAAHAVELGAQDYLTKSELDHRILARTVCYAMERAANARRVEQSKALLQSALDALAVEIVVLDAEGRIVAANERWHWYAAHYLSNSTSHGLNEIYLEHVGEWRGLQGEALESIRNGIQLLLTEQVQVFQKVVPCALNGQEYWYEIHAVMTVDPDQLHVVVSHEDVTRQKATEEQLKRRALHDVLSGLANRELFEQRLSHALERLKRQGQQPCAVLFMDLDRFKPVNDTYGHRAGDHLLKEVANRLRDCVRPGDTVARFGGDEFAVLLEEVANEDEAVAVADRMHEALNQPFDVDDQIRVEISVSIGVFITADPTIATDQVMHKSDLAMYQAKRNGRSRTEVSTALQVGH